MSVVALVLLVVSTIPARGQAAPTSADIALLADASPAAARRAYNTIRTYFQNKDLSVLERSDVGRTLLPELGTLINDPASAQTVVVPAIFILGDIATEEASMLLNTLRRSDHVAVRFPAVVALGNTLGSAKADSAPAIGRRQMLDIIDWLGDTIENDTSPNVVRTALDALFKANDIKLDELSPVRDAALVKIATAASSRLQKITGSGEHDQQIVEACVAIGQRLRNLMLTDRALSEDTVKQFAGMGGDILSGLDRMMRAGSLPMLSPSSTPADRQRRERAASAATLGVNLVFVAHNAVGRGAPPNQPDLAAEISKATVQGDTAYTRAFRTLVGDILSKPPFAFRSERFLR